MDGREIALARLRIFSSIGMQKIVEAIRNLKLTLADFGCFSISDKLSI